MSRPTRSLAGALLCPLCLCAVIAAAGPAAATGDYPRVLSVRSDSPTQVSLDVVVPPLLATGRALPPSAFQITDNGKTVPVTSAARLSLSPLRVVLVFDTSVPRAALEAQQGAAREFIFGLPPQARVGVISGGPDPEVLAEPTTPQAAVQALLELQPQPPEDAVDVTPSLTDAVEQFQRTTGTNVVIAVDSRPATETVPYDVAQTALQQDVAVYALLLRTGPRGYLGGLPAVSGGRVVQVNGQQMLVNAFDTVASELLGRYRLGYLASGPPGRAAQLVVSSGGVREAATFAVGEMARPVTRNARPLAPLGVALTVIVVFAVLVGRLATPRGAEPWDPDPWDAATP